MTSNFCPGLIFKPLRTFSGMTTWNLGETVTVLIEPPLIKHQYNDNMIDESFQSRKIIEIQKKRRGNVGSGCQLIFTKIQWARTKGQATPLLTTTFP
jgi:hypothetical protein